MERAKRLELTRTLLQACSEKETYATAAILDVAGNAQAKNHRFPTEKVQAWAEELDEIVCAWPMIGYSVQHGLMAIVRSQCSRSGRP